MKHIVIVNGPSYWLNYIPEDYKSHHVDIDIVHIVEYNDVPGLLGFSDECKRDLVNLLIQKI